MLSLSGKVAVVTGGKSRRRPGDRGGVGRGGCNCLRFGTHHAWRAGGRWSARDNRRLGG